MRNITDDTQTELRRYCKEILFIQFALRVTMVKIIFSGTHVMFNYITLNR